jgi:cytochrome c5
LRFLLFFALARVAAGQYVSSEACSACHAAQFTGHAKTGHARALARSVPPQPGEWAFGAGLQAITFVSRIDEDSYLEHGLTWYAAAKSLALTPGHRSAAGERYRTFDPDGAIFRCFQCHSTGPLRLAAGSRVEPAEPGVGCEVCHGPGKNHVEHGAKMRNPKSLTAAVLNQFCGACHRKPAAVGGDTDWSNPWNARHEPLYLAESKCFRKSAGKLSCLTCHPPHEPMSHVTAAFDRRCAECHAKPAHKTRAQGACVSCHMPAVAPGPGLRFTNHWIGIYAAGRALPRVK